MNVSTNVSEDIYDLIIINEIISVNGSKSMIIGISIPEDYAIGIYEGTIDFIAEGGNINIDVLINAIIEEALYRGIFIRIISYLNPAIAHSDCISPVF